MQPFPLQAHFSMVTFDVMDPLFPVDVYGHPALLMPFHKYPPFLSSQDLLQQPLMEFLGRESPRSGINTSSVDVQKLMLDPYEVIKTLLDSICNQTESKAEGR